MNGTLIFDFDGTLCDSYIATLRMMNEMAPTFRYSVIPESEFESLRGMNFEALKHRLGMAGYKIPFVLARGRKIMRDRVKGLKTFDGLLEALRELRDRGVIFGVLSSNSKQNVEAFLEHNGLLGLFDFVYGEASTFGKGRLLKKIMKKERVDPARAIYVGDEARDVRAAKSAGIRSIAVLWGFNTPALLEEAQPDVTVARPDQLALACETLFT